MSTNKEKISEYLNKTRFVVLATVDGEGAPFVRSLGSFAADGATTYFSTGKGSAKVGHIQANPQVSLLFQHEDQQLPSFYNITVRGVAKLVTDEAEIGKAVSVLSGRNPSFKERLEKGLLANNVFFRVDPGEVKVIDFSKGSGPAAVELIDAASL